MSTLRMMAQARDLEPATLLTRLELDPANHDVDEPLRARVELLYSMVLEGPGFDQARCQCEHGDHEAGGGGHPGLAWPAGVRLAMYVGRVCDGCAVTHLAEYLVGVDGPTL